jgi:mannose-6-phosphate isomerase-like protein (cupin superfamily)
VSTTGSEARADEPTDGYRPSPRPTFDRPVAVTYASVTRHIWGDPEAGEVADWIYASTDRIHALVFGLPPGKGFRHSHEFRTVFAADEVMHVLNGTMVLANPESGEVQRIDAGGTVFFRADTWHHAFAHGSEELRVLELFAPPPAAGTAGAYARTRPLLERSSYADDAVVGHLPDDADEARTLRPILAADVRYRLVGEALVGLLASTEHLTVASLSMSPGAASSIHAHGGDEVLYVRSGVLHVRAWFETETYVFELRPGDAAFVPLGAQHEYRNYGATTTEAILGVAPFFL